MLIAYPFRFLADNIRRSLNIPSSPFLLNYSITLRCNLNCRYCGVFGLKDNYAAEELAPQDIADLLKDARLKRLAVIAVSGGEPFLKEDIAQILLAFRERAPARVFHITTNGYLTEKICETISFLKNRGANIHLKISIDDIGERHDALRGRKGSFKHAVLTIEHLKQRFTQKELFIGINQTIFEDNYTAISAVKKLARVLDCDYRGFIGLKNRPLYLGMIPQDYGLVDLSAGAKRQIKNALQDNCLQRLKWRRGGLALLEEFTLRHYLKGQLKMLAREPNSHRCMNLFTHFRLNPNGDIITCSYDLAVLGNIKQESYSSILHKSQAYEKMRKVKSCGKCWLGCEVSPNFISSLFAF